MHQKMSFGELPQDERASSKVGARQAAKVGVNSSPSANPTPRGDERHRQTEDVKECPVCHARCFADMDVCYNCLHAFRQGEGEIIGEAVSAECDSSSAEADNAHSDEGFEADDPRFITGDNACSCAAEPVENLVPCQVDFTKESEHEASASCSVLERPSSGKKIELSADSGNVIQILVSISLANDACIRNGIPLPTIKIEAR